MAQADKGHSTTIQTNATAQRLGVTWDPQGQVNLGPWEYLMQFLIVVSLIDFAMDTVPGQSPEYYHVLDGIEIAVVVLFTIEYAVRLLLARPWSSFAFSFYGIIDFLAVLPFYLSLGHDLRSIRAFRLLRLFRVLKLVRYSAAIRRFQVAFQLVKEELILFGSTALIVVYLSSVGIYYFEHPAQPEVFRSVFDAMWWSVVTLTTVGYGDIYPITVGGRIFTFVVLITGLGIVAIPAGLFASALTTAREHEEHDIEIALRQAASARTGTPAGEERRKGDGGQGVDE